jgi:hypothetical protein
VCGALGSGNDTSIGACDASPLVSVAAIACAVGVVGIEGKRIGGVNSRNPTVLGELPDPYFLVTQHAQFTLRHHHHLGHSLINQAGVGSRSGGPYR